MYQRLKNSLLFPKQLVEYINEKMIKTILIFIAFALFSTIPSIIINCTEVNNATIGDAYSREFAENSFSGSINNYELECNTSTFVSTIYIDGIEMNLFFITNSQTDELTEYAFSSLPSDAGTGLYIVLNKTKVYVGLKSLATLNLFEYTYEELEVNEIDFVLSSTNTYKNNVELLLDRIYQHVLKSSLAFNICSSILATINDAFISVLVLSLILMLCYRLLHVKFGKCLKITMLCSLPYFIFVIISESLGISFISIIGEIIMILYSSKLLITDFFLNNKGKTIIINGFKNVNSNINDEEKDSQIIDVEKEDDDSDEE